VSTPDEPEHPPGYVPAPGGYGYVPEDYRWGSQPGPATPSEPGKPALALWWDRAMAGLVDFFGLYLVGLALYYLVDHTVGQLVMLLSYLWGLYNGYLQGQTTQSVGKRLIGLATVREQDGKPIGAGAGFGRAFLHLLDAIPCGVGFLFPLWDRKRQTFADKIMGTIVVRRWPGA
jgi:uncharacterized RDD family membrane protein YckC